MQKKKKNQEDKSLQETIDEDIRLCENSFKAVNGIIAYTNVTMWPSEHFIIKNGRNEVQRTHSKIEIEINRKRKLEESPKEGRIVIVINLY